MNIFILNRGSSSIKCYLYRFENAPETTTQAIWEAIVQWKNNFEEPTVSIKDAQGNELSERIKENNASASLKRVLEFLVKGETAALQSLDEIDAVGHRIVHGGNFFSESVLITPDVKEKIRQLAELAPLHNLPELEGIETLEKLLPKKPQIAVFDTAFHHTLPQEAHVYPGPYGWYEDGIRRYGFHGISFQYCAQRAEEILNGKGNNLRTVICHLGSGASLCAVKEGKSIDTTMGFTPLEGLMMDTRSGTIDPGIILHFLEKKKKSADAIANELYKGSGLLGLSGTSSDMRDIIEMNLEGNARAKLAFDVYLHRLNAMIGSMVASLQGIDLLIFTAGIGENASLLRKRVCEAFSFLGVKLDFEQNERNPREDCVLSASDSKVQVLLIHTQEAFEIARECWKIL
ncbi:MAG: acetate kinase [Verrucomicrobia bacterium]|nr:acetate kinase [Verrucomicrobiota bacterium]